VLAAGLSSGFDARLLHEVVAESPTWLVAVGTPATYSELLRGGWPARDGCRRIAWIGEPIAPAAGSGGLVERLASSRLVGRLVLPAAVRRLPAPRALTAARGRVRYGKELGLTTRRVVELADDCDEIVLTSRDAARSLAGYGLAARAVPFGYEPSVHGPLASPESARELPFVSLAHHDALIASRRHARLEKLIASEPRLTSWEGVWGEDRNALLRRTRIVVNVQRVAGTFFGLRLVMAIAAGAVVVSEPMTDPYPFVPGVHFVEAPLDRLLDEARDLLDDEPRRQRIAEAGQALLAAELTMTHSLERVLFGTPDPVARP
jgi:hypothetical protein